MSLNTKKIFMLSFDIVVIVGMLQYHEHAVVSAIPVNMLFCIIWGVIALIDNSFKIPIANSISRKVIYGLFLYFIIWSFLNLSNLEFSDRMMGLLRSLLMMFIIAITCYWVKRFGIFQQLIHMLYITLIIIICLNFIMYFSQINLTRTFSFFWVAENQIDRYRTNFGFLYNNIAAEYAMSAILLSIYEFNRLNPKRNSIIKIVILAMDFLMMIIIVANNSRGTIIALICMLIIYLLLKSIKRFSVQKIIKFMVFFLVIVAIIIASYLNVSHISVEELIANTNRGHMLDNIDILLKNNRILLGLGHISGAYFSAGNYLYGMKLNYMEMFYAGVFVKSGVIGCIWIMSIIIGIFKNIYKSAYKEKDFSSRWVLLVFIYMLFISLFEEYLFSYTYITSTIFLIIILSFLQIRKEEIITTERVVD